MVIKLHKNRPHKLLSNNYISATDDMFINFNSSVDTKCTSARTLIHMTLKVRTINSKSTKISHQE